IERVEKYYELTGLEVGSSDVDSRIRMEDASAPQVTDVTGRLFEFGSFVSTRQAAIGLQPPAIRCAEHAGEIREPQRGTATTHAPDVLLGSIERLEDAFEIVSILRHIILPELLIVHARILQPHVACQRALEWNHVQLAVVCAAGILPAMRRNRGKIR